jgi:hypothetical protein
MTAKALTNVVGILFIAMAVGAGVNEVSAGPYPLEMKLKQCEIAFQNAHSSTMSQAEAAKARRDHAQLVREILQELNKRNAAVDDKHGKTLSQDEILNNFRVMGRMLEMIASDHQPASLEWSYTD